MSTFSKRGRGDGRRHPMVVGHPRPPPPMPLPSSTSNQGHGRRIPIPSFSSPPSQVREGEATVTATSALSPYQHPQHYSYHSSYHAHTPPSYSMEQHPQHYHEQQLSSPPPPPPRLESVLELNKPWLIKTVTALQIQFASKCRHYGRSSSSSHQVIGNAAWMSFEEFYKTLQTLALTTNDNDNDHTATNTTSRTTHRPYNHGMMEPSLENHHQQERPARPRKNKYQFELLNADERLLHDLLCVASPLLFQIARVPHPDPKQHQNQHQHNMMWCIEMMESNSRIMETFKQLLYTQVWDPYKSDSIVHDILSHRQNTQQQQQQQSQTIESKASIPPSAAGTTMSDKERQQQERTTSVSTTSQSITIEENNNTATSTSNDNNHNKTHTKTILEPYIHSTMTLQERVEARAKAKQQRNNDETTHGKPQSQSKKEKSKQAAKRAGLLKLANVLWSHTRHTIQRQSQLGGGADSTLSSSSASSTRRYAPTKGLQRILQDHRQQQQQQQQQNQNARTKTTTLLKPKQTNKQQLVEKSSLRTVMKLREIVALYSFSSAATLSAGSNTSMTHKEKVPSKEIANHLMDLSTLIPDWIEIAQDQLTPRTKRLSSTSLIVIHQIDYSKVQAILGVTSKNANDKKQQQHDQQSKKNENHTKEGGASLSNSFGKEATTSTSTIENDSDKNDTIPTVTSTPPPPSRARMVSLTPPVKQETHKRPKRTKVVAGSTIQTPAATTASTTTISKPKTKHSILHSDVPREKKREGLRKSKDIVPYENRDEELAPAPKKSRIHNNTSTSTTSKPCLLEKQQKDSKKSTTAAARPTTARSSSSKTAAAAATTTTTTTTRTVKTTVASSSTTTRTTIAGQKRPASPLPSSPSTSTPSNNHNNYRQTTSTKSSSKKHRGLRINENFILTDGDYDGGEIIQPSYTSPRGLKKLFHDLKEGRRI